VVGKLSDNVKTLVIVKELKRRGFIVVEDADGGYKVEKRGFWGS